MSSQSPQRMRKVQATHQGQPTREMSPSPTIRDRQRTIKASSLSHMPSVAQVYSNMNSQTQPQSPQANGNGSNIPRRSPPASQVPQPGNKIPSPRDDDHMTPPPPPIHTHSGSNIHSNILPPPQPHHSMSQPNIHSHFTPLGNPRPIRVQSQHLLQSFHNADENWQMTDELLADIERADLQLQQGQHSNPPGTFGVAYAGGMITGSKMNSSFIAGSPPRDSAIDSRVKVNERPVQKDTEINHATSGINGRRQREQQAARESPNNRDRPTHSPEQDHFHSPQSIVDHNPSYNQYKRETYPPTQRISTPPIMRRPTNASFTEPPPARATPPGASKLSSHSPPGQAMNTRPPDRSLPVQEEPEDDMVTSKNGLHDRDRDSWRSDDGMHHDDLHDEEDDEQRMGSPTPSSDAHPEGHAPPRYDSGRNSAGRDPRAGQSEDDDQTLIDTPPQRLRDREEEEESFTPRSPSAPLPEDSRFYNLTNTQTVRAKMGRNSSTDQLNLRNFESAALEQNAKMKNGTNESNQGRQNVVEQTRRSIQSPPQQHQQPPQQQQHLQQEYSQQQQSHPQHPQLQHSQLHQSQPQQSQPQHPQQQHLHQLHLQQQHLQQQHAQQQIYAPQYQNGVHLSEQQGSDGGFYIAPDDETQSVTDDPALAAYMYYYQSARPNAPIPPTPQSHTAAPSPSPMMSDAGMKVLPPMTPIQPVGSPYPFPFGHVRRTNNFASRPNIMTPASNYDQNNPAVIQEQIARQLEAYARNNHVALSDSTFSPSATPFQGPGYNPWAVLHNRAYGGQLNASMSLQSSPSHEPIQLPYPTPRGRVVKKRETQTNLRRNGSSRKPPPRVESTQPRETSPELSTSGEETAGEDQQPQHHYGPQEIPTYVNGISHDDGDWIDEDDDGDEDDLLDLEYHPTFVTNIEKRRRRWETRWETLVHAFQALDRQTDATLILLASPSHSTKLHSLTSRSIRRDQSPAKSQAMSTMRSSFRQLSSRRKSSRTQKVSLAEMLSSGSSIDGSPVSHGAREEELRRALGGALGSLGALGSIYEQREARWREEMRKITEEREKVEFLLKQALGPSTGAAVGSAL